MVQSSEFTSAPVTSAEPGDAATTIGSCNHSLFVEAQTPVPFAMVFAPAQGSLRDSDR
jgi:hypothetical protein